MSDLENTGSSAGQAPAAPGEGSRPPGAGERSSLPALVASHLELAALHEAFIERQTALHVRVLQLLNPGRRS